MKTEKVTVDQVAKRFNVPPVNAQRQYARNAAQLRQMQQEALAGRGNTHYTAEKLGEFAAMAEEKAGTPVLDRMKLAYRHSQGTPCFTARLSFEGVEYQVSNDGHGGANRYYPVLDRETGAKLDKWAAANNPPFDAMMGDGSVLPMDFETWIFGEAFAK